MKRVYTCEIEIVREDDIPVRGGLAIKFILLLRSRKKLLFFSEDDVDVPGMCLQKKRKKALLLAFELIIRYELINAGTG